ncbi:MAG: non-ribosomal peptide synthetase [Pseudomonadota bacterium]
MTFLPPAKIRTIARLLEHQVRQYAGTPALIAPDGETISHDALWHETERLAAAFSKLVPSGDATRPPRVGIVLPNGVGISVILLAVTRCATAVPFNPAQTQPEFEAQFEATRVDAIVLPDGMKTAAFDAALALSLPVLRITPDRTLLPVPPAPHTPDALPDPDDTALVLMTSGSTGKPKIVPLSHRNLCRSAFDVATSLNLTPEDRCLVMWEQFHIGGLVDLLLAPLASGGSLVAAGSFDAARFFDLQDRYKATWFQGVPTSLGELLRHAKLNAREGPLPRLRLLRSVAAALPPAAQQQLIAGFGVPVVRTLGMTEAGPLITSTAPSLEHDKPGSVGRSAGPDVVILSETGSPLATGETGQVAVRGENVFAGYEHNPEANALAFRDGWFLTGDMGYLDAEGDLFLTGRAKEMINRGGEKIFPNEVEDALMAHPRVQDAACFALPHATLGEDVACALVVSGEASAQDIRDHLTGRVARHKIPGQILFLPELPRNPVGKTDRQALVSQMASRAAAPATSETVWTPMQALVADIWKEELSLAQVGLDDDFASVDGDSLSAVRILVSLETHFGVTLPAEIIERFATIRDLSTALEAHGFNAAKAQTETPSSSSETAALLTEKVTFSGGPVEAKQLIANASGRADMRLKMDFLVSHLAPSDVASVLNALGDVTPCSDSESAGFIESMRIKRAFAQQLAEMRRYLPKHPAGLKWQRQDIAPGVLLYSDPAVPAQKKDLIVGFSGNRMRLLMPAFRILDALDPEKHDLLLLADHSRNLFRNGIPSVCADVPALGLFISQFCAGGGYNRLLGIGTSGGSLAVVAMGIAAQFDAVACVAPASLDKHTEWWGTYNTIAPQHDPDQTTIRIIHGRRAQHRVVADEILRFVPMAEAIRYPHASKRIFPDAQDRGILTDLLNEWLS